jgi:hypothetical protein
MPLNYLVCRPLPEIDRDRVVSHLIPPAILSTRKSRFRRLGAHDLVKLLAGGNSEQSGLQLVLRIYAPSHRRAMPKNGAALWIQVEKKLLNLT